MREQTNTSDVHAVAVMKELLEDINSMLPFPEEKWKDSLCSDWKEALSSDLAQGLHFKGTAKDLNKVKKLLFNRKNKIEPT